MTLATNTATWDLCCDCETLGLGAGESSCGERKEDGKGLHFAFFLFFVFFFLLFSGFRVRRNGRIFGERSNSGGKTRVERPLREQESFTGKYRPLYMDCKWSTIHLGGVTFGRCRTYVLRTLAKAQDIQSSGQLPVEANRICLHTTLFFTTRQ